MSDTRPIVYILDPSVAATGAFVAARQAARLLRETVRIVLVLPQQCSIEASELQDFFRVEYIPMQNPSSRPFALLRYVPALLIGAWQLRRLMARDHARRLQINDFYALHGVLLRLMGFRGNITCVVRCHPYYFAGALAAPLLWLARASANHMVVVSRYLRDLLPQRQSVTLLYDCFTGQARIPYAPVAGSEKVFVHIANYIEGKGQDNVIAAFASAATQEPTLRLAFYGGDMGAKKHRAYRRRLEAQAAAAGVADRIAFHGFLQEPSRVLANAYAALNASASESFSFTVLEAQGAGVPVISTACGGPQEIIVEGVTGYLVPVGDVPAMARAMLQLAANPRVASDMGTAAANHVRMQFSPQQFMAQWRAVMEI